MARIRSHAPRSSIILFRSSGLAFRIRSENSRDFSILSRMSAGNPSGMERLALSAAREEAETIPRIAMADEATTARRESAI
jgi:hypothetical protein